MWKKKLRQHAWHFLTTKGVYEKNNSKNSRDMGRKSRKKQKRQTEQRSWEKLETDFEKSKVLVEDNLFKWGLFEGITYSCSGSIRPFKTCNKSNTKSRLIKWENLDRPFKMTGSKRTPRPPFKILLWWQNEWERHIAACTKSSTDRRSERPGHDMMSNQIQGNEEDNQCSLAAFLPKITSKDFR